MHGKVSFNHWHTFVSMLGVDNPIRYRGYYYDTETGLYYLQSRYYAPDTGRFINADDVAFLGVTGTVLSCNLFAYCENDPVNAIDLGGYLKLGKHWWNKVSTVGKIIDIIICFIPVLAGIAKLAKAGSIAAAASQAAAQLGRKALRESFVKMSVKLSVKTG